MPFVLIGVIFSLLIKYVTVLLSFTKVNDSNNADFNVWMERRLSH